MYLFLYIEMSKYMIIYIYTYVSPPQPVQKYLRTFFGSQKDGGLPGRVA